MRTLQASVPTGIEARLRLFVTESADSTASLRHRTASVVFSPCKSDKLDGMAAELAPILGRIVRAASNFTRIQKNQAQCKKPLVAATMQAARHTQDVPSETEINL
ncbi:MAG: hypothetical protein IBX54_04405 [Rhodoferax sp.]|nr:hypothetical protein [Rhodoferax sp.]